MSTPFSLTRRADPLPAADRAAALADPGFGRFFSDHMASARWTAERGWHDIGVIARAPLLLDPAAGVLHYAQEIFEGLKAYRLEDGALALFRPHANAARFAASATRLAMPELPAELFVESCRALVEAEGDWLPEVEGGALYLRPFMIADEAFLGVRPSASYRYIVLASPSGSYWRGNKRSVSLWVSPDYSRAGPGGTGAAKCGGNYAASLAAQAEAHAHGCDQVVFLDACSGRFVEELGGMNLCFVFADGRLRTPPLAGTILPGITRDSLLTMARDAGISVEEAPYALEDWRADAASGRLTEAFACGTAAVVTPVSEVRSADGSFSVGDGGAGPVTARLHAALTAVQRGRAPDPHGWVHRIR